MANLNDTSKIQEFIDLKEQQKADGIISQKEYNEAMRDAKVGIDGYTAKLTAAADSLKKNITGLGSSMVKGESGASVYNKSLNSAADLVSSFLDKFGLLGKVLGFVVTGAVKYVSAVNQQADKLFETYQDISRSGLATGMDDTFKNLQQFGYTVSEISKMGELLKENANTLAQFGGTAAGGASKFAELASSIQSSHVGIELQRMGMSIDDINQSVAGYMRIQQITGQLGTQTNQELKTSTVAYINQQAELTRLTGLTAKQQNSVLEQAYAEQTFNAEQYNLRNLAGDPASVAKAARNEKLVKMFAGNFGGPATAALQKYLAGAMNQEDAQKFRNTYGKMSKMIDNGVMDVATLVDQATKDAEQTAQNFNAQAQMGNAETTVLKYSDITKVAGRTYAGLVADNEKKAQEEIAEQKAGGDPAVANMVKLSTAQRNQTQAFETLINDGINPVTKGINALSTGITSVTGIVSTAAGKTTEVGKTTAPSTDITGAESLLKFTGASGSRANFDSLSPDVKKSFLAMVKQYGKAVTIESANRSFEDQKRLYDAWEKAGGSKSNPEVSVPGMGRVRMPAKPGTSPHESGRAIDLDLGSYSGLASLLGQYGFKTVAGDPGHIQMASGGMVSGPRDGYDATLHGTEAVIPMDDKKAITVNSKEDNMLEQHSQLLSMKISKLDQLIKGMQTHYDTSSKILLKQS